MTRSTSDTIKTQQTGSTQVTGAILNGRSCIVCGKSLTGKKVRYCSDECIDTKNREWSISDKYCLTCGEVVPRRGVSYCSDECRDIAHCYKPKKKYKESIKLFIPILPETKSGGKWESYKRRLQERLAIDNVAKLNPNGEYEAYVKFHVTGNNCGDLDNFVKAFFDCLTGIIYRDDMQIKKLNAEVIEDEPYGFIEAKFCKYSKRLVSGGW